VSEKRVIPRAPTAEDVALARQLVASGRLDVESARRALAELSRRLAEGATLSLAELLGARGPAAPPSDALVSSLERSAVRGAPEPGERFGRYAVLGLLGRGGMGAVYRARDEQLGREVALKVLLAAADPGVRERFAREARAVAALRHPGIVALLDAGDQGGVPYLALELVEGETLLRAIERGIESREAARIAAEVAAAVGHAHSHGIVHRDLKPANVLLEKDGRARVSDFGLARVVGDAGKALSAGGEVLGTPAYMSPEQAAGEASSELSDVYGIGAVLYEMLAGRPPHEGATPANVIFSVLQKDPPAPRSLNPKVHSDLETICQKALEKEPARRYASAGALALDLERFVRGEPIEARPQGAIARAWRRARGRRLLGAALAVAFVSLVGASVVLVQARRRETDRRAREESDAREARKVERRRRFLSSLEDELDPAALVARTTAELERKVDDAELEELGLTAHDREVLLLSRRVDARQRQGELARLRAEPLDPIYGPLRADGERLGQLDPARGARWAFVSTQGVPLDDASRARLAEAGRSRPDDPYGKLVLALASPKAASFDTIRALATAPASAIDIHVDVARNFEAAELYGEALNELRAVATAAPRPRCGFAEVEAEVLSHFVNARDYAVSEMHTLAIRECEAAIRLRPTHEPSHVQLVASLNHIARFTDAVAKSDEAIRLGAASVKLYLERGNALLDLHRPAEALAAADEIVRLDARAADGPFLRERALLRLHRAPEALEEAEKGCALVPEAPIGHLRRAEVLAVLGRLDEADAECKKVLARTGSTGTLASGVAQLRQAIAKQRAINAAKKPGE
jgi:serine/threonine-protein kinase